MSGKKSKAIKKKQKRNNPRRKKQIGHVEALEDKRLFCVDWSLSGGVLNGITSPSLFNPTGEVIVLDANGSGQVIDQGSTLRNCNNTLFPVNANQITKINIKTRAKSDTIDLSRVDTSSFPNLVDTRLDGDSGNDVIKGSQVRDVITGNSGNDQICGNGGNDDIDGGWGADIICGGDGNDVIRGSAGSDILLGGNGDDRIYAGAGADLLDGGPGRDYLDAKQFIETARDKIFRDSTDTVQYTKGIFGIGRDTVIWGASGMSCPCEGGSGDDDDCVHETDFGDAPNSYGTNLAADGARHLITAMGPRMGDFIDAETDGKASSNADWDDLHKPGVERDDEDGVVFLGGTHLNAGGSKVVRIDVQNLAPGETAKLDAWVDFDGNGRFDATDRIANSVTMVPGSNNLAFTIPYIGTRLGPSFARFRISTAGGLGATGEADNGEVEDYMVDIGCDHGGGGPNDPGPWIATDADLSHVLSAQVGFITDNLWDDDDPTIGFGDVSGIFESNYYAASHGVHIENVRGLGVVNEGDPNSAENIDGYDGSIRPDGDSLLVSWPNNDNPLTLRFDEPVVAVGSFLGMGAQGDINTITIEVYDANDNLLDEVQIENDFYEDTDNRESYWSYSAQVSPVSRVVIRNDNPSDFGNAVLLDDLTWRNYEAPPTFEDTVQTYAAAFENVQGSVDLIEFEDVAGEIAPDRYLAEHGIFIESSRSLTAESAPQVLDGYDGSYQPVASHILVGLSQTDAEDASLNLVLEEPALMVGMFLGTNTTPDAVSPDGYDIVVYDTEGDVLLDSDSALSQHSNSEFGEGFVVIDAADLGEQIGRIEIRRVDGFGQLSTEPIMVDSIQIVRNDNNMNSIDFDGNGVVDVQDVDLLVAEVANDGGDSQFDLNNDAVVDLSDLDVWLTDAALVNGFYNSYVAGDANLDGVVDVTDFNAWNANKFSSTARWSSADFNADGVTDVTDFNTWNANKFTSIGVANDGATQRSLPSIDLATGRESIPSQLDGSDTANQMIDRIFEELAV